MDPSAFFALAFGFLHHFDILWILHQIWPGRFLWGNPHVFSPSSLEYALKLNRATLLASFCCLLEFKTYFIQTQSHCYYMSIFFLSFPFAYVETSSELCSFDFQLGCDQYLTQIRTLRSRINLLGFILKN